MAVRITRAGVALTVGIIVLTGLIIGGLFWVRQSGEQARRDEATKIAEQNLEEQSGNDVALNDDSKKNDDNDKSKDESSSSSNDTSSTTKNESESSSTSESSNASSSSQSASELPQTGPAETGVAVIALGATTFAAVAYYRSRRSLFDSL